MLAKEATNGSCLRDLFKRTEWDVPWAPTDLQKWRGELLPIAQLKH